MGRCAAGLVLAVAASLLMSGSASAALEITLSLSPREGIVGRPVEILVRTYVPIGAAGIGLSTPSLPYPAASGLWNVLYPIPDYPFDVTARSPAGEAIPVSLVRDPADASLWRGTLVPDTAGEWSVAVANFPTNAPVRFFVRVGDVRPSLSLDGIVGLVAGLFAGLVLGIGLRRRRHSSA